MGEGTPKPVVLAILDGWGVAPDNEGNAITKAKIPNFSNFIKNYPAMTLSASGTEVGLSWGEMGNSEVGHLNIGAGRVYYQTLPRINQEINSGNFFKNPALLRAIEHAKSNGGALHLLGLLSPGNVHASQDHAYALLKMAAENKIKKLFFHAILDGRDTAKNSALTFVKQLIEKMDELKIGKIATMIGRYYAMDRDNRWDRTAAAYSAIIEGKADIYGKKPLEIIEESYRKKIFDEEFPSTVLIDSKNEPVGHVKDGDAIIFFNFRPDRARQLTQAMALPAFPRFERPRFKNLLVVTMTEYEKDVPAVAAYPPVVITNCLAEAISKAGKIQFHVAETEKYAHVTFFLNGTIEEPFKGEKREIIPSPAVESYTQTPEMSAGKISDSVINAIKKNEFDLIVCNFANADMVGHTGDMEAAIAAVEAVDKALGKIADNTLAAGGALIITADHGNAEEMIKMHTNEIDKEHSTNPVPFLVVSNEYEGQTGKMGDAPGGDLSLLAPIGVLGDVAPTVLKIMNVPAPPEMTGHPLI